MTRLRALNQEHGVFDRSIAFMCLWIGCAVYFHRDVFCVLVFAANAVAMAYAAGQDRAYRDATRKMEIISEALDAIAPMTYTLNSDPLITCTGPRGIPPEVLEQMRTKALRMAGIEEDDQ
jgi:hypothetical protein